MDDLETLKKEIAALRKERDRLKQERDLKLQKLGLSLSAFKQRLANKIPAPVTLAGGAIVEGAKRANKALNTPQNRKYLQQINNNLQGTAGSKKDRQDFFSGAANVYTTQRKRRKLAKA